MSIHEYHLNQGTKTIKIQAEYLINGYVNGNNGFIYFYLIRGFYDVLPVVFVYKYIRSIFLIGNYRLDDMASLLFKKDSCKRKQV
jgi:hypothetical protein